MARDLTAVRQMIARIEGRSGATWAPSAGGGGGRKEAGPAKPGAEEAGRIETGLAGIDRMFPLPGLAGDAVHEIHGTQARLAGAATGFVLALLSRLQACGRAPGTPVLWVQDPVSAREAGRLYAPGVHALGYDPGRIAIVAARSVAEALWAMEEGLGCLGLAAVVGEITGSPRALGLTASRRLALRAARTGRPLLLLRTSAPAQPSAATSRWRVAPLPSAPLMEYRNGLGRAAWRLELIRNRDGATGAWNVEWNPHEQCFTPAAADPVPVAAAPGHRPADPARPGSVVALARAG